MSIIVGNYSDSFPIHFAATVVSAILAVYILYREIVHVHVL